MCLTLEVKVSIKQLRAILFSISQVFTSNLPLLILLQLERHWSSVLHIYDGTQSENRNQDSNHGPSDCRSKSLATELTVPPHR